MSSVLVVGVASDTALRMPFALNIKLGVAFQSLAYNLEFG
jgi:hypothetical protein